MPADVEGSAVYFLIWPTEYTHPQNGPDKFEKAN
jgi:hypothetical protein